MSQKFSERDRRRGFVLADTLPGAWREYSSRHLKGWTGVQLKLAQTIFMAGVATAYDLLIVKGRIEGHKEAARDLLVDMADWVVKNHNPERVSSRIRRFTEGRANDWKV